MKLRGQQIKSVIALPAAERYRHFIKVIADWQEVWGLYKDGWALAEAEDGVQVFPLWPAREYAQLCADKEWSGYEPRPFTVDELLHQLLPRLKKAGVLPGIFYTPQDRGVTISVDEFANDLHQELRKY
jgi:hypothetical protein